LRRLTLFAKGNLDVRDSLHALRLGGELPAPVDPPGTSISSSLVAVLAALCIGGSAPALAQTFPARTVKITAPYSAGAAPAVFTRALADKLSKAWGQPVIVESKPGASGFVAIEAVKAAPADGHELLVVSDAHVAINPSLYTPFYLAVASAGPYASVPALIAAAKANPGTVSYGSSYVGSPSHLGSAEFEFTTGTKMIHVPYRDQSQMYVGIANGDVGWAFTTLGSALPLMQAGRIKLIAIAAAERSKVQPDVPTLAEAGGPASMRVGAWLAIVAPRGTPADVVRRINADVNKVLADPEVLTLMRTLGFEPTPETPEQFADEIRADARRYGELVRRTGATAD
jgi:tripartite-type tricarboxylate transporter receptor subunit TctC